MFIASVALIVYMAFIGAVAFVGWQHQQQKTADEQYVDLLRDANDFGELYRFVKQTYGPPYHIEHQLSGKTYFLV